MRGRRVLVAVASALLLAGLTGACRSSAGGRGGGGAPVTTTTQVADGVELVLLRHLMVDKVPAGFTVMPDAVRDTGPSDLEKAVRDQGGEDADRDFLVRNGFLVGYQRLWRDQESTELLVFVYKFATFGGARAEAEAIASGLLSSAGDLVPFQPAGIPGATGLETARTANRGVVVMFAKGGYWAMVQLVGDDSAMARAKAIGIARDQYDRLP